MYRLGVYVHTFFFHVFITLIQFFSSSCLNVKCFLKKGKKLYIPHILFQKFTTFFISLSISVTTFPHESSYIGWNQYRKFGRRKFSDSEIKHTDNQTNWFNWIKAGENWNLKIIFSCWITQVNQSVHFCLVYSHYALTWLSTFVRFTCFFSERKIVSSFGMMYLLILMLYISSIVYSFVIL